MLALSAKARDMVTLPQLEEVRDRFDVYRRLNGQVVGCGESPSESRTPPRVKSFLLEHMRPTAKRPASDPARILQGLELETRQIDDTLLAVIDTAGRLDDPHPTSPRVVGYLETYDPRFFALYTTEKSADAQRMVSRWLDSPELDHCWFNSHLLQTFWEKDVSTRGDRLYGKLVFQHESRFETPGADEEDDVTTSDAEEQDDDGESTSPERRRARFTMGDRIGKIRRSLGKLQECYSPLHALCALRFPSRKGHGGHDLHQNGRVTNWTHSFEEHRNLLRYLWRCYRDILDDTEEAAWQSGTESAKLSDRTSHGVPLIIRFHEKLSLDTFNRWVSLAFTKRNPFRLWGQPMRLGPTKVHVYGADRHLWQPLNLELTDKGLTAILPEGTCGNTFHRLVTNIQHYVCPAIDVWLGNREFSSLAMLGKQKEREDGS